MWLVDRAWVSRDVGIIYFLNNPMLPCPFSSAVWRAVVQRPKGSEFDSRSEHLFLNIIKFFLIKLIRAAVLMESKEIHEESTESPRGVSTESIVDSPWSPLYFGESLWTPCGLYVDCRKYSHGLPLKSMESMETHG